MSPVEYFKLQAKNLLKDYKTQKPVVEGEFTYFEYSPTYFDIDSIFVDYDWDEENFTLMKAQHLIAVLYGFDKWGDLINASNAELELAKLVWDNQHKIGLKDWNSYVWGVEAENNLELDPETKIEIFTKVFVEVDGHHNIFLDYRLNR